MLLRRCSSNSSGDGQVLFGVHTTPVLFSAHGIVQGASLILCGFIFLAGCQSNTQDSAPVRAPSEPKPVQLEDQFPTPAPKEESVVTFDLENPKTPDGQRIENIREDDHNPVLGPADADVTWIIFAGWQCPFSGKLVETIRRMHQAYPTQLRILFKHTFSPNQELAKEAAMRLIMEDADTFWGAGMELLRRSPITTADLNTMKEIDKLKDEQTREALVRITMDLELAESLGIRSTPQSIINGLRITGSKSPEIFEKVIAEALRKKAEGVEP